ncbi:acyl-CoA thioesterase [Thalassotalea agarivorans]|uniref:Acyl-CoA thioester hydrolase n=1 Tax=Thalassotalea agarivorans TaxID=349064 RepID=A0A1I0GN36_THASX|nr:thioesterase family protein [Thalassotalea agarivorans]SET72658.1 acyl-CoA thioester hydrolase [Thalassotalea agarivorans]
MFVQHIEPRFTDTDALGHINNTVIPVWFEGAREPIFKWFTPTLSPKEWRLILANISVNFLAQIYYGKTVEIRTSLSRIGGSSFTVFQEVWQDGKCCANGEAVMVHFDYKKQKSAQIPDDIRAQMQQHLKVE